MRIGRKNRQLAIELENAQEEAKTWFNRHQIVAAALERETKRANRHLAQVDDLEERIELATKATRSAKVRAILNPDPEEYIK